MLRIVAKVGNTGQAKTKQISRVPEVLTFYLLVGNGVLSGSSGWSASGLEHGSIIIWRLVLASGLVLNVQSHIPSHIHSTKYASRGRNPVEAVSLR